VPEPAPSETAASAAASAPAPRSTKRGSPPQATLYTALDGAGSADGRSVAELREAALAAYESLELPSWRRSGFWTTSLRELRLAELEPRHVDVGSDLPAVVTDAIGDDELAGLIVQVGATVVRSELDPAVAEQGVVFCSLEEAVEKHPDLVAEHYLKRLPLDRDKLGAANAAFWTGGAFLHVPANVKVDKPFQIAYAITEAGTAQYAHTLITGATGCEFSVREYDLAPDIDGQALHAGAFELYLADNARARVAHFQDWGKGEVYDVSTHVVEVGRDGHCGWIPIHLGGHLTRQHLELVTAEQGSDMLHRGIYFAEGDEHLDLFTVDLHEAGHTTGDTVWHGAATGAARASYEGLIKIVEHAQESHTYLQAHSMMLSPRAKVDAIPSLIVETDSVSASHGGTVGEIDEAQVFYMQARGIPRKQAIRMIVEGYFEPIVVQLHDPSLEEQVRSRISAKLAAAADDIEAYTAAKTATDSTV
jgi:Fe-S cluster assembly protein SufD